MTNNTEFYISMTEFLKIKKKIFSNFNNSCMYCDDYDDDH
jgi:hypothetical protein